MSELDSIIKNALADFFFGSITRKEVRNALSDIGDNKFANFLEEQAIKELAKLSLIRNNNFESISQSRSIYLRYWYSLVENDSLFDEKEGYENPDRTYLLSEIKGSVVTEKEGFEKRFRENLLKAIDNYLADGISELYLINLVNRMSFTNNKTEISVFDFNDKVLVKLIITIIDFDNSFSSLEVSPKWSLEKDLLNYKTSLAS